MMAVLDLFDDGSDLAAEFLGPPHIEEFADTVCCQAPQADFAAALEDFVDGKVAFEDEVAAVFGRSNRSETGSFGGAPAWRTSAPEGMSSSRVAGGSSVD